MKRIIYSLIFIGLSAGLTAQTTHKDALHKGGKYDMLHMSNPNPSKPNKGSLSKGVEIWSNDFSNASDWSFDNSSSPTVDWSIITDVNASPVAALNPISTTSASNGFAFINADVMGDGSVQNANIKTSASIDLSAFTNVALGFEQVTRNWATTYSFIYSIDNGSTWNTVQINQDITTNTNSGNPGVFYTNVSQYIAGQPNVRIGFNYTADWGWFWAIDDVYLAEPQPNDLTMLRAFYDDYIIQWEVVSDEEFSDFIMTEGYEYRSYKTGQVRPFTFVADVVNNGTDAQTNVKLMVSVTTPSGTENFESAAGVNLAPNEQVFLTIPDITLAAFAGGGAVGDYTVSFEVVADQVESLPSDNTVADKVFTVDEMDMGNDNANTAIGNYLDTQDAIWGTRFHFTEATEINFIRFALGAQSVEGEVIDLNVRQGSIIEEQGTSNPFTTFFGDGDVQYVIEGDALSTNLSNVNWIVMPLPNSITIPAGMIGQGEIYCPAAGESSVAIPAAGGQEPFAGCIFDFNDDPSSLPSGFFGLGGNAPLIRLGFDTSLGVEGPSDLSFKLGQNYPNPTNGNTRIDWELLVPAKNVQFHITDVTGKVVYAINLGDRPAGLQESLELNLNNFAAGNYQYSLIVGNERIVRKMVIVK